MGVSRKLFGSEFHNEGRNYKRSNQRIKLGGERWKGGKGWLKEHVLPVSLRLMRLYR